MPDQRLHKIIFCGEMQNSKRSQGCQKKCFKETLKTSLKSFGTDPDTWESAAQHQTARRKTIRKGAATYEESRTLVAEQRWHDRKTYKIKSLPEMKISCPHCPRIFYFRPASDSPFTFKSIDNLMRKGHYRLVNLLLQTFRFSTSLYCKCLQYEMVVKLILQESIMFIHLKSPIKPSPVMVHVKNSQRFNSP